MTNREAIDIIERCIHVENKWPGTEYTVEALEMAVSLLQEREERSKGCRYCSCGADMKNDEDMGMDLFNYAEGMDFSVYPNYCPMCGRKLKGAEYEAD